MNRGTFSRSIAVAAVLAVGVFSLPAYAQNTAASATGACPYWIDAATGQRVNTYPAGFRPGLDDPDHFYRPGTSDGTVPGKNFVRTSDGSWIDAATGQRVNTYPAGFRPGLDDPDHFYRPGTSDGTVPGKNFVNIPCPPPTQASTGNPPPPPVRTPTYSGLGINPPPSSYFGAPFGLSSGTFGFDYAHFSPSSGSDGNQYGLSGSGLFALGDNFGLNLDAGYHNVSSSGPNLSNWTASGALVWQGADWRLGPNFGFQSNSKGSFSSNTYNYGAYADYFVSPAITLSGKGGGFSSNPGSGGYYLGGALKGYVNPDFAIDGAIDYTRFTSFGGSSETDFTIRSEWLVSESTPVSVFGGYTYSGFSPGSFNVSTVFVGIKLYTNGNGATTLVDRQRTGTLGWSSAFMPLSLRF